MKKREIIQPILWIERSTGAVMGPGSLWSLGFSSLNPLSKVALKISIALHWLWKKFILFCACFQDQHLRTLKENSLTDESLTPNWMENHMKA